MLFAHIVPNWYASVMGTGIVANAAATLPLQFPGLHTFGFIMWLLAVLIFLAVTIATTLHWFMFHERASAHHTHPVFQHFYGALPMAILTIGAGFLIYGKEIFGITIASHISIALWSIGTILGLATAIIVPYFWFNRTASAQQAGIEGAFGGWLMSIVPPMVSAALGPALIPYLPQGQWQETLLWCCYGMFGISLMTAVPIIVLLIAKLGLHGPGPVGMVPTLFIVLGPLGQSVTAVGNMAEKSTIVVDESTAEILQIFGQIYGMAVLGFALLWTAIAVLITFHAARNGMNFSLTWWSFTFPVGTCVTGFSVMSRHIDIAVLDFWAVVYYGLLVVAWFIVAARTFHASIITGALLLPPK
ncbi:C4-dicarboxylate ABC transporter [Corynebacterium sp. sy017]|nr:C4-dicarboxylate ABC transporter [Corynebacterium sp. sy017]QDZ43642.1 C4-dicarboxylate ABC transporter [Corynebacterium sp. sy039]TSD92067.1 C4-dicarboxylate ABC transporter [Corynebacterium sp. SY003]